MPFFLWYLFNIENAAMSIFKRKGSPYYYAGFSVQGRKIQECLKTSNKKVAQAIHDRRYEELRRQHNTHNIALAALRNDYLTYAQNNYAESTFRDAIYKVDRIIEFLKKRGVHYAGQITTEVFEQYKKERIKDRSPRSYNSDVDYFRRMLNLFWKDEWGSNPARLIKKIPENKSLPRAYTQEEAMRIVNSDKGVWSTLWHFILVTGCRLSEALDLKWSDIRVDMVIFRNRKSRQDLALPLPEEIIEELKSLPRYCEYVFSINGHISRHTAGCHFRRLMTRLGLKGNIHMLRHTAATHLLARGVDLATVSSILGHKNIITTQRYTHMLPDKLQDALSRSAFITPPSSEDKPRSKT